MSYTILYNEQLGMIETTFRCKINPALMESLAPKFAEAGQKYKCSKFLGDLRQAALDLSVLDIHDLPHVFEKAFTGVGENIHVVWRAIVIDEDPDGDFHFLETVCRNRGQPLRVFTDIEAARKWLQQF